VLAALSLNTQCKDQQTPGVAPGLGNIERKKETAQLRAPLIGGGANRPQQLTGSQSADKNRQRSRSHQLTQQKTCVCNG
jgi:hypothetical protein